MFRDRLSVLQYERRLNARQQALTVPWRHLHESACAYVEWLMFVLWVRAVCDAAGYIPDVVAGELRSRCPGFSNIYVDACRSEDNSEALWRTLWNWIEVHEFGEFNQQGWYDAVMFYAGEDLRSEQIWARWEIASEEWSHCRPDQLPMFPEWKEQVLTTYSPVHVDSERARALMQLGRVQGQILSEATVALIESRALASWVAVSSEADRVIDGIVRRELCRRFPEALKAVDQFTWNPSLLRLLVGLGSAAWMARAKSENWSDALRYSVVHHPRRHRLLHYFRRCQEQTLLGDPCKVVEFSSWLRAADAYVVTTAT